MEQSERLAVLARRAADEVEPGTLVGLGSGSTAEALLDELGRRVAAGHQFKGVATSERTASLAAALGIALLSIDQVDDLDLCLDGADEIDPAIDLVKGRGGALLWEKLVAIRARRFIIIAAAEKLVPRLGVRLPLPIEIVPFGWRHTARALDVLGCAPTLRRQGEAPFVTDGGHFILDCTTGPITDAPALAARIKAVVGVVEHGLFVGMADRALIVDNDGHVATYDRPRGE
jgi:ribose 5-phosphate isomerase A